MVLQGSIHLVPIERDSVDFFSAREAEGPPRRIQIRIYPQTPQHPCTATDVLHRSADVDPNDMCVGVAPATGYGVRAIVPLLTNLRDNVADDLAHLVATIVWVNEEFDGIPFGVQVANVFQRELLMSRLGATNWSIRGTPTVHPQGFIPR